MKRTGIGELSLKSLSPLSRLFLILSLVVAGESIIMFLLSFFSNLYWLAGAIIDVSSLLIMLVPSTYLLFIKPLINEIDEKTNIEGELKELNKNLEQKVEERTEHLAMTNEMLQHEITGHQKARADLEYNRNILDAILESIDDGIVVCNREGELILFNRAGRKIYGLPVNFVADEDFQTYCEIFSSDGRTPLEKRDTPLCKALAGEMISNMEMVIAPKNATNRIVLTAGRNLIDKDGEKLGAVISLRDITEYKEAEKKLREKELLLIQHSKMASMGEMMSAISHQWRQPLNALGLIVQDFQDAHSFGELDTKYVDDAVAKSMHQINFMSDTIDSFKNFFKPSREKATFEVKESARGVISLILPQLKISHISCTLTCHIHNKTIKEPTETLCCNEMLVTTFKNEFEQVILNLINNARDAILERRCKGMLTESEKGVIAIDFYMENDNIVITVRDNGGGIPEHIIDRIFEPYFSTKEAKGTGIGLSISKTIVEHIGGSLQVRNIADGAEFRIEVECSK
jgi:PAS domain S-box-containing protein